MQDKQAEHVLSQQLGPVAADSSDVLSTHQGSSSNSAVQWPLPTSAQPGLGDLPQQEASSNWALMLLGNRVASPTTADVQVTTDASDPLVQLTDANAVVAAGDATATAAGGATVSEAETAEVQSQHIPETPKVPGSTAGAS